MLSIFLAFIGAAVVLPALARWIGRGVFPLAALVAAAGFVVIGRNVASKTH